MRIYIDWEFNFKEELSRLICKHRGHLWIKYKVPSNELSVFALIMGRPQKICKRCGQEYYKPRKMGGIHEWVTYKGKTSGGIKQK